MLRFLRFVVYLCGFAGFVTNGFAANPLLLRNPAISKGKVAFLYADDIWTASREGGEAERLTSIGTVVGGPYFSPDGSRIAYSARIAGNVDVYVMSAEGGVPRRLTWHPRGNMVSGWSPDGRDLIFASTRNPALLIGRGTRL